MSRLNTLIIVKVLFAFLGFSAVITEIATLGERDRFAWGNFFSYFTVESNALAVISLLVSAFAVATGYRSPRLDFLRGAVTLYMTTTIIIFIVLLSGLSSAELTAVP
ncbi:MAG: FAR7a/AIG1-like family protein, partial [Pseudonocardiales bacterium]|nr:FAR7a/AIG1-like family protein [Pseudonocardiales bacterium]